MTEVHNSISARSRDDPTVRAGWLEKTTRQCEFQCHLSILVFPYGFNGRIRAEKLTELAKTRRQYIFRQAITHWLAINNLCF